MTADEARDLFSEAYEGELDFEKQQAFAACLSSAPDLAAEYESFRRFMNETRSLGATDEIQPDLLPAVQGKIRARSRRRYYRDRFSTGRGASGWLLWIALAMIVILGGAWLALYYLEFDAEREVPAEIEATDPGDPARED